MARDVGVSAVLSIGGSSVSCNLQATSPDFTRAMQPIILATGGANSLVGYAPSSGAKSGFRVGFDVPYSGGGGLLNAMLSSTPFAIILGLGAAGGSTCTGCLCTDLQVSGSEGGNISCTATFDSTSLPSAASGSASAPSDVFKFIDVVSATLVGGTYTDVSRISWRVMRKLAAYKGNSPSGIAKYLKIVRTEAMLGADVLQTGNGELTASIGACPTVADCALSLVQQCVPGGGGGASLALSITSGFYQSAPTVSGGTEDFISLSADATSLDGGFAAA